MNTRYLRRALGAALLAAACMAQAAPSPKDVDAVMRSRDWPRAESMLKDVISAKPESAKPRYYLAQVYEQQGRVAEAARELQRAEKLDPALSFSKDVSKYYAMKSRLAQASAAPTATVAAAPRAAVPVPAPARDRVVAPSTGYVAAATVPAPVAATSSHASGGGVSFGKLLMWLAVLGAIGGGIFFFVSRRAKQQAQAQAEIDRRDALKRMLAVKDAADKAVLDMELAGKESSPVCVELRRLATELLGDIGTLQRTNRAATTASTQPSARERRIVQLTQMAADGKTDAPAPVAAPAAPSSLHAEADAFSASTPARQPSAPMAPSAGYQYPDSQRGGPTTVIVERDRDPSLLETIALSQVLSHQHEVRERVIERTVIREVPAPAPAPRYRADDTDLDIDTAPARSAPAPAAALDLDDSNDQGGGGWDAPAAAPAEAPADDKWD